MTVHRLNSSSGVLVEKQFFTSTIEETALQVLHFNFEPLYRMNVCELIIHSRIIVIKNQSNESNQINDSIDSILLHSLKFGTDLGLSRCLIGCGSGHLLQRHSLTWMRSQTIGASIVNDLCLLPLVFGVVTTALKQYFKRDKSSFVTIISK
jgi:hypothetical protein